jgi:cell division septum initiation protein DivIVA
MQETNEATETPFTTSLGPVGYDVEEVDRFRGAVLEALSARDEVISGLRAELEGARAGEERDGSSAAARVLELATVNADQLLAEARAEADALVAAARVEADELATEVEQRCDAVLADLDDRRAELEARIEALTVQEAEHRERLREHFVEQLARLGDEETGEADAAVES